MRSFLVTEEEHLLSEEPTCSPTCRRKHQPIPNRQIVLNLQPACKDVGANWSKLQLQIFLQGKCNFPMCSFYFCPSISIVWHLIQEHCSNYECSMPSCQTLKKKKSRQLLTFLWPPLPPFRRKEKILNTIDELLPQLPSAALTTTALHVLCSHSVSATSQGQIPRCPGEGTDLERCLVQSSVTGVLTSRWWSAESPRPGPTTQQPRLKMPREGSQSLRSC